MEGLKTKEDRRFQTFWVIFFILISVIAIIPVLRVISISFSGRDAIKNKYHSDTNYRLEQTNCCCVVKTSLTDTNFVYIYTKYI